MHKYIHTPSVPYACMARVRHFETFAKLSYSENQGSRYIICKTYYTCTHTRHQQINNHNANIFPHEQEYDKDYCTALRSGTRQAVYTPDRESVCNV